jgi:hypothetical protein
MNEVKVAERIMSVEKLDTNGTRKEALLRQAALGIAMALAIPFTVKNIIKLDNLGILRPHEFVGRKSVIKPKKPCLRQAGNI